MTQNIATRLSTALADRYRVERELGAGGMATVYLAHDLKHDRRVALKVLKPELAAVLGADRFVVEIRTTAALQHPHILPLFDSGEADGFLFYVMPFIDGETLRAKLDRETQLGVVEAVRIACDVADALHHAHSNGVIHRDIKPENILLANGRPMVADFGIALAVSAAAGGRMTETGLSLGTPHYMSPEQATAEKEISARSDIYSLGATLYEMLAGQPPHLGGSAQQIIMKIITEQPAPVTQYRKSVPANVAAAVAQSLEKLPADRFESARAFAGALANAAFTSSVAGASTAVTTRVGRWKERAFVPVAAAALIAIAAAVWSGMRLPDTPTVSRYQIALQNIATHGGSFGRIAMAPDGSRLIYKSESGDLWVRNRDQLHATQIPGPGNVVSMFVSPDGASVGFVANRALWTVSLLGGSPVKVTSSPIGEYGGSWGRDGFIVADAGGPAGLIRVRATPGSTAEPFTRLDSARGERDHTYPEVLPGGRGVLFVARIGAVDSWEIAVADVKTGAHRSLVRGIAARYARSGHLLFVTSSGVLMAASFDERRMRLTGEPVALAESIAILGSVSVPDIVISDDGTLVYGTASLVSFSAGEPVWVSRDGRAEPVAPGWTINAAYPALSNDGTQLAISLTDDARASHLWVRRLADGTLARLTDAGTINYRASWFEDDRRIAFVSDHVKLSELYAVRADDTGSPELLLSGPQEISEALITRDGQWLVYRQGANSISDLYAQRLQGDTTSIPLATSAFLERMPAVSPDGRYIAYVSNETGRQVYVRPFPDVSAGKWVISPAGGQEPVWSRDGTELFYRNGNEDLVAVEIVPGRTPPNGRQRVLFSARPYAYVATHQNYDVMPDGQRFIMIRKVTDQASESSLAPLVVVENFFEELRRRVPK